VPTRAPAIAPDRWRHPGCQSEISAPDERDHRVLPGTARLAPAGAETRSVRVSRKTSSRIIGKFTNDQTLTDVRMNDIYLEWIGKLGLVGAALIWLGCSGLAAHRPNPQSQRNLAIDGLSTERLLLAPGDPATMALDKRHLDPARSISAFPICRAEAATGQHAPIHPDRAQASTHSPT